MTSEEEEYMTVGEKIEAERDDDDYELVDEETLTVPKKSKRKLMPIELL